MRRVSAALSRLATPWTFVLVVLLSPTLLITWNHRPVPTAYATTAVGSPTPASSSSVVIYDNGLGPQFADGAFGFKSKNSCDPSIYYSAPCSYGIEYTSWGALNFQIIAGSLNTAAFTTLQYKLYPNGLPISDFSALLASASGNVIKQVVLSSSNVSALGNGWMQVTVPLSLLNPAHVPVSAVQLKNQLNSDLPKVHYDDINIGGYTGGSAPFSTPSATQPLPATTATSTPPSRVFKVPLLPGQKRWNNGVSSLLFGSNDSEEWAPDNVQTDPHGIIQSSIKSAHLTLGRTFIFHYSLRDGHRTTIGTQPKIQLKPHDGHTYDKPIPPAGLYTGAGYEVETRIKTLENMGMQCLAVLPDIWTTPKHNVDPDAFHQRIIAPETGKPETDLDFARRVVAYLGNRCNLYEIGNEPDLDQYTENGLVIHHMDVQTYVERWTEFVTALRKINPKAKFIGPVTYNNQGNDCTYTAGKPFTSSQPGDCYMQNFLHAVKGTHVEPDAVSFHWYPCSGATLDTCTATQWNSYAQVVAEVRSWIYHDLGHMVPVGITEWNFDPGGNTALGSDPAFMEEYTRAALASMISARVDFAAQFDIQDFGGYGALDMFDLHSNDQPKAQFHAMSDTIKRYRTVRSTGSG
jgi:Glycoside hydrolase family 44